jgi:recombination protein RecA
VAEFDILYGEGISRSGELLDLGVEHRIVQKSGSWYSVGETRIGQGREAARAYFAENPELADDIEVSLREKLGLLPAREKQPDAPPQKQADQESG